MMTRVASCFTSTFELTLETSSDIDVATVAARVWAHRRGAPRHIQWELALITSEAVANAVIHGGGGELRLSRSKPRELMLEVSDRGPGIVDVTAALSDGFSRGKVVTLTRGAPSLGCGLGAIRRLSDAFEIDSGPERGTKLIAVKRF